MSIVLENYVQDRFAAGDGGFATLYDPTTEAPLASCSTRGVDFAAALDHARRVGGNSLRGMTFAERGAFLLSVSRALHQHREVLVELAIRNGGNTRSDAKFDIDGATGTLAWYGKLGETLGARRVLVDGSAEGLARNPRYIGQHVLVPRQGAAVHINAFNFPAWGLFEKAAVAWLAGVPVITKPATSTALVAWQAVRYLVEAAVLPPGVLTLLCGSTGDLLEHMGPQDHLAFTGSSATGRMLRQKDRLIGMGVRVNIEADSLNASVLGPDVEPGTDTWDMWVREAIKDMSQKAGQKCTAIRRILVPAERVNDALDALAERADEIRVGDPSLDGVNMGPLCTADQHRDVRQGIARLAEHGAFVRGDGGRGRVQGAEGGWFVAPTLLRFARGDTAAVHADEVFGPVQSVLPYDGSAAEAGAIVALGQGSLVSSIYSDDERWTGEAVGALAPWCGRLHCGSQKVADHSPGPGTVLPQMVHGGPGRAGAGEELGGARGLAFYQQRTAVQGLKNWLERLG